MDTSEPIECAGPLFKLGGGVISRLQERFFVLYTNGNLKYYEDKTFESEKGTINIKGARVVDRGTYMKKCCFSIDGVNLDKGAKEYFFFADRRADKWRWFTAVMRVTGRYTFEEESSNLERLKHSPLYSLLALRENQTCADCGAPFPTWAVIQPYGAFVCIECIGVHRNLWAPKCKEVEMDEWDAVDRKYMATRGNEIVNGELEFCVPTDVLKPNGWSDHTLREAYVTKKYNRAFAWDNNDGKEAQGPVTDPSPKRRFSTILVGAPPRYTGITFIVLTEAHGFSCNGATASLTNGFQEVISQAGIKHGDVTQWNQQMQIGLDTPRRPLYITIFDGEKIVGTAELIVSSVHGATEGTVDMKLPLSGKEGIVLRLSVYFSKLS